jgi:Arc/MetJ family transcription regulator
MKTTINMEDDLLKKAMSLSHLSEKNLVVRLGLQALIVNLRREQNQKLMFDT